MKGSILASFKLCGVWPFDESRLLKLLEGERPTEALTPVAVEVLEYIRKVEDERVSLKNKFKEVEEREVRLKGKVFKRLFTSTYSQVLTSPQNIAFMQLDNLW